MTELFRVEGLWAAPVVDSSVTGGADPEPILQGLDLAVGAGEVHAIMGPNGSGKSTLASSLMGSPEYEVTAGTVTFRGDDVTDWPADERAKAGHVPRLPVPPGDPRRLRHPVPPPGAVGPQGHRPLRARAARLGDGVDAAPRHGLLVRRPLPQRGLLRRREEAQRDHADGDPRAGAGDPRRDRLRPRHRRPARRRQRHPRGPQRPPRHGRRADHPLPAPARRAGTRPRARADGRPHRRDGRDGDRRGARARRLRGVPGRRHERRRRATPSTRPRSRRSSRCSSASSTAPRSTTSTRRTRRRSRSASSTR